MAGRWEGEPTRYILLFFILGSYHFIGMRIIVCTFNQNIKISQQVHTGHSGFQDKKDRGSHRAQVQASHLPSPTSWKELVVSNAEAS